jgi:hypothetical protein
MVPKENRGRAVRVSLFYLLPLVDVVGNFPRTPPWAKAAHQNLELMNFMYNNCRPGRVQW